jgi:hypothetical protein
MTVSKSKVVELAIVERAVDSTIARRPKNTRQFHRRQQRIIPPKANSACIAGRWKTYWPVRLFKPDG